MPQILPVSDLKNYCELLGHCDVGSPVYLTKNGRGKYVVQSLADFEKQRATIRLLSELIKGVESLRDEDGLTQDHMRLFSDRQDEQTSILCQPASLLTQEEPYSKLY